MNQAHLILGDGTIFSGNSFGYEGERFGEVVFNTSMSGYQEILTDPSYEGQIVVMTSPQIGNYGVNPVDVESKRIFLSGFVVKEYSPLVSNFRARGNLSSYLKRHRVCGIEGFDTRALVRHIRDKGAMPALMVVGPIRSFKKYLEKAKKLPSMEGQDLARLVSCRKPYGWNKGTIKLVNSPRPPLKTCPELVEGLRGGKRPEGARGSYHVIAYDYGIKHNILRMLVDHQCRVKVVPADFPAEKVLEENPDGVFLSNGPGDPSVCRYAIENVKKLIGKKPLFGICLGHQIMGLAMGAKTFKLKFGHHGANQPVMDLKTNKVEITAQNHGFAIDPETVPSEAEITHINLNDQTVEGIRHKTLPVFSVQYHPEASPGPHDSHYLFKRFIEMMNPL